jgi:hypothetical protein
MKISARMLLLLLLLLLLLPLPPPPHKAASNRTAPAHAKAIATPTIPVPDEAMSCGTKRRQTLKTTTDVPAPSSTTVTGLPPPLPPPSNRSLIRWDAAAQPTGGLLLPSTASKLQQRTRISSVTGCGRGRRLGGVAKSVTYLLEQGLRPTLCPEYPCLSPLQLASCTPHIWRRCTGRRRRQRQVKEAQATASGWIYL